MILDVEYLRDLLARTMDRVDAPDGCAVLLEGSIAEGFGNSSSDIDFLVIVDEAADQPTMPSILFIDGRRVEVRTRSARQLAEQFDHVRAAAATRRVVKLSEDVLNRCQRLLRGVPLRNKELIRRVQGLFDHREFAGVMRTWWAHRAQQAMRYAIALAEMDEQDEAVSWARAALTSGAKSWAAERGETYLEPKWLPLQLDRLGGDESEEFRALESRTPDPLPSDYLAACRELLAAFGIDGITPAGQQITVERAPGVTTWPIGERVHVVRDKRDVFVFGDQVGRTWQSVVFGRPLVDVLSRMSSDATASMAQFVRLGLVRLAWHGNRIVPSLPLSAPPGPITPPPSRARPIVTLGGAVVASEAAIDLVPLPARRFGAAAMTLVWSNVLIENAREDLDGALDRGQWRVAELTARRVVQACLRGLLSAHGINPLPPDSDLIRRLPLLDPLADEVTTAARQLDQVVINKAGQGRDVLVRVERFVARVRADIGARAFPASFHSEDAWQATLDIGYDWLRLGAYLAAELPIDEARDLLASGGAQPHTVD